MTPFARITGGNVNITGDLTGRLLSVEVHDDAGSESDRVTIRIDDRPRAEDGAMVSLPAVGLVVEVEIGYREGLSRGMGTYHLDSIDVDAPPATLTVAGRSAKMPSEFRSPRSASYHQRTLGEIVDEVAGRNGFEAVVEPSLASVVVRHIDQHNESDMAFVARLAAMYDSSAKPVEGRLVLARNGSGRGAGGGDLPVITITPSDCSQWSFSYSARDEAGKAGGLDGEEADQQAAGDSRLPPSQRAAIASAADIADGAPPAGESGGVRAFWNDIRSGERREVTIGQEPYHDLRFTFRNEAEARAAASAYKNKTARGNASFSCSLGSGDPLVQAEALLILEGFRPYIPPVWRIKTATHRFEPGGGYTTTIQAELFEPEQEDVAGNVSRSGVSADDMIDPNAPARPAGDTNSEYIIQLPTRGR